MLLLLLQYCNCNCFLLPRAEHSVFFLLCVLRSSFFAGSVWSGDLGRVQRHSSHAEQNCGAGRRNLQSVGSQNSQKRTGHSTIKVLVVLKGPQLQYEVQFSYVLKSEDEWRMANTGGGRRRHAFCSSFHARASRHSNPKAAGTSYWGHLHRAWGLGKAPSPPLALVASSRAPGFEPTGWLGGGCFEKSRSPPAGGMPGSRRL